MPNPQDIVLSGTIGLASKRPTFAHERFGDPGTNVWRPYTNQAEIETLYSASQRSNKAFLTVNGWGDYNDGGTVFTIRSNSDAFTALTDGATIVWDASAGLKKTVTLGGNRSLSIVNSKSGDTGILYVKQDNIGGRTLALPANSLIPSGWALSTGANQLTVIGYSFDGINYAWSRENYGAVATDTTPPQISSATATTATNIRMVFNEPVTATLSGWSFNNGSAVTPSAITSVNSTTYDFTVGGLAAGQTITYTYNSTTGNTLDAAGNEFVTGTGSVTNSIASSGFVAVDWTDEVNTVDSGSGTLTYLNSNTPAGARASQSISGDGEVRFIIPTDKTLISAVTMGLYSANDVNYDWGNINHIVVATAFYTSNGDVIFAGTGTTGSGTTISTTGVSVNAGDVVALQRTGNDILVKRSTNSGTSFTTIQTLTGVAAGFTELFIRSTSPASAANKVMNQCTILS